ncbi:hypothetical protein [Gorillibacterium timonense]|uniref:hypothetical protein n=1 Tax=Gorillibacterium timonense TaxID=1689269 RepID=UPI00071CCDC0|nr:hypothetical protein [Gorillibacterium timonense]
MQAFMRIPSIEVMGYTVLAFLIPYAVYRVNQLLHQYGDPPWKKETPDTQKEKSNDSDTL